MQACLGNDCQLSSHGQEAHGKQINPVQKNAAFHNVDEAVERK